MSPDATRKAAEALVEARRAGKPLKALPAGTAPRTVAEGYEVQAAFRKAWPGQIAGWKVGATARAIMQRFGIDEPLFGPFYAADVLRSPAKIERDRFTMHCLETEMTFRLDRDLPARSTAYQREEIEAAVGAVIPSFELIGPRFETIPFDRVAEAIADCGLNGGMVLGEPVANWRALDLVNHPARLTVEGQVKGEGTGRLALDDPVNVLEWCVNALSRAGIGIKAGQMIATGTLTGVVMIKPGERAIGDFGTLGRVEVSFI